MNTSVKALLEKKHKLQQEVEELERTLEKKKMAFELRNNIQKLGNNGLSNRDGIYGDINQLSDYETKWKNSFFVKHRLIAEKYGRFNLSQDLIQYLKETHYNAPYRGTILDDYFYGTIIVFVEACIPTSKGPVLKLSDPYNSIFTEPIKMEFSEACNLIDRIIVANIGFHYNNNKHPLKGFRLLKFTLYEDLRNK